MIAAQGPSGTSWYPTALTMIRVGRIGADRAHCRMSRVLDAGLVAAAVHWGGFTWTANFTAVDLVAATTNALNGALLARRPDYCKQFTVVCDGGRVPVGYVFRTLALFRGWEEPLAKELKGVVIHDEGRPLLGRKLAGKSRRELRDLGLLVEDEASADA